jgi:hemolysin activation/secretion protein
LMLLNEYSGVAATAALEPGEEVGTTRVIVDLAPTALVDGSLQIDNHGSRYTGEWRAGAEARVNNILGRGEQFVARGLWSQDNGLRSGGLSFSYPFLPRWSVYGGVNFGRFMAGSICSNIKSVKIFRRWGSRAGSLIIQQAFPGPPGVRGWAA